MSDTKNSPPKALMLLATHCGHCPAVLEALTKLLKQGVLSSLEVDNIEYAHGIAEEYGVKSVPWVRMGWFELEGQHSIETYRAWAERVSSEHGVVEYLSEMLQQGEVNKVLRLVEKNHSITDDMLKLLTNADEVMNVRLGISVVIEEYASSDWFQQYIPQLAELITHADPRVRADACHYLSLTNNIDVVPIISALLNDASEDVREVARESLDDLGVTGL